MNARHTRSAAVVAILCVLAQTTGVSLAAPPRAARAAGPEAAWSLARAALAEFQAGRYAQSAELYEQAWRADPAHPGYLFGVGRAEQKAGHWQAAIVAFENLQTLLPAGDPIAVRARKSLKIVKAAAAAARPPVAVPPAPVALPVVAPPAPVVLPAAATPAIVPVDIELSATPVVLSVPPTSAVVPAPPVAPQVSAAQPSSVQASVWLAAGLGAACVLGAGATGWSAWQADRDADRYRVAGSQRFDPVKISQSDAATRIDAINTDRGLAIGLALVGVAATAAGAWFWRAHRATTGDTTPKAKASP